MGATRWWCVVFFFFFLLMHKQTIPKKVVNLEGRLFVFEFDSNLPVGVSMPVLAQSVPINTSALLIADIDDDGRNEVVRFVCYVCLCLCALRFVCRRFSLMSLSRCLAAQT